MDKKDNYVYSHTRLDTNEVFYIGIGKGKNKYRAKNKKARNNYWLNIVNKTEYKIDILFDNLTREEACNKEIELIAKYGRFDKDLGNLVNFTNGGEGRLGSQNVITPILQYTKNGKFVKEWKNVLDITSNTNLVKTTLYVVLKRERLSTGGFLWFYKEDFSNETLKETINSIIEWKITKSNNTKTKIKVYQYTKDNKFIKSFDSINEAALKTNTHPTGISNVLAGRQKSANKYLWKRKQE